MKDSKLIELLKTFSREELSSFRDYLRSPYLNKKQNVIKLYAALLKFAPGYDSEKLTEENLYSKIFTGKQYNYGTMKNLVHCLNSLAAEFIIHSSFMKREFQKRLILLEELDTRKLYRLYEKNLTSINKLYKKTENLEDDYFKNNFELEVSKINYNLGTGKAGFNVEDVINDLQRCSVYLLCYTLITAFKLNQDILVSCHSTDFDYRNTLVNNFIESLSADFIDTAKKYAPEFYDVLAIYQNRFLIASGRDTDDIYYYKLKELVLKNISRFTRFEKYNLMLFLENSCDENIRRGKDFNNELHEIHKIMLERGLVTSIDTDYFPIIRFRRIITLALSLGKTGWAEGFAKKYLPGLPDKYRNNMKYYSQAFISFYKDDFGTALENLTKVKSEVYSLKFDMWSMKLQALLELEHYEQALNTLDSYKHLLGKDTASPEWMRHRFKNFMDYYEKILKNEINEQADGKDLLSSLEDEISKNQDLVSKRWLLNKIKSYS